MRQRNSKLKAIDLFCGVGGLSLGLEESGFEIVGARKEAVDEILWGIRYDRR